MVISKRQMQSIVEEIGETIHRNINFMDETGCIIASTDPVRIGMQHSGAKKILKEHLDQIIISSEGEDSGTRTGINLPIVIEKQIVGVVGITGEIEEVKMLGQVIKKMTEILIWEQYQSNQKKVIDDMKKSFAVEWLFGDDEEYFITHSRFLNINPNLKRVIAIADIIFPEDNTQETQEQLDKVMTYILKEYRQDTQQLVLNMGMKAVFFLVAETQEDVKKRLEALTDRLEKTFHCSIFCGIGSVDSGREGLRKSYKDAEKACEFAKSIRKNKIELYNESDVYLLLENIPVQQRSLYLEHIFRNVDQQTTQEILQCLRTYVDNNGSIYRAAQSLYIHKNTLQYRLNKIKQVTGYDPRILNEAIPLYIAMLLSEFAEK